MKGIFWFPEAVRHDPSIDVWLHEQAPELGALARTWFQRMHACGRDVRELMHDGCPTACVGGAAFGYVSVFRAHANVGFFHGATLEDPTGLLEGTGKRMRHVKIKPGVDLDPAALAKLISTAYADMKLLVAAEHGVSAASTRPREGRPRAPSQLLPGTGRVASKRVPSMNAKQPRTLHDGSRCTVVGGTHEGKTGTVRDINKSKTGHVTITVVQPNGERFKTLARNVVIETGTA